MISLNSKITELNRIGKATAGKLKKIGIVTAEDLLLYFPFRYEDYSAIIPINKLIPGQSANVIGEIELIQNKKSWKKRMHITEALVNDGSESIKIIWFNQPFIARNLHAGDKISLAGKIESDYGGLVMKSPNYEKVLSNKAIHTQGLVPNYHLTATLTAKQLRFLIKQILYLADQVSDWLPKEIITRQKLISLNNALKQIHFPQNKKEIESARNRLAFDEIFSFQLRSQIAKRNLESFDAPQLKFSEEETRRFVDALPFKLSNSQKKAAWEILKDMENHHPMSRILSGDVGSGKTIVAAIAALNTVLSYKQAVIMAPTEILAKQHFETFCKLFKNYDFEISLITSSEKKIFKNSVIKNLKSGVGNLKSEICIGTHTLIQGKINFQNLGLIIIDEQHRFGVNQRALLQKESELKPHFLSMTATPIPRSLALALYSDLELSIIDELPSGRKKIITKIVENEKRNAAYDFIRKEIKNGHQIFVICPLIDESDKLGVKSVKKEFERLDKEIFPEIKTAMLHGRMPAKEKEKIMKEFQENKIKILVSTSVIEVGIDIPNATVMMIEGADRFGLAQLHQFRGRVGRSGFQSYCFLFSESASLKTENRLDAMVNCNNGFELAKMDLKARGAGEIYGTAQKGFPELKIANLLDYELMKRAKEEALKIIETGIEYYPALKNKIEEFNLQIHLE